MGLIDSAIKYKEKIDLLYEALDRIDRTVILMPLDDPNKQTLRNESHLMRNRVNWLDESMGELFDAIDKALEDR